MTWTSSNLVLCDIFTGWGWLSMWSSVVLMGDCVSGVGLLTKEQPDVHGIRLIFDVQKECIEWEVKCPLTGCSCFGAYKKTRKRSCFTWCHERRRKQSSTTPRLAFRDTSSWNPAFSVQTKRTGWQMPFMSSLQYNRRTQLIEGWYCSHGWRQVLVSFNERKRFVLMEEK